MEEAVQFFCSDKRLYGIIHLPDRTALPSSIVIVLTGGPQVRTGSHRLYVDLSRYLATHEVSSFRFDYEGSGDSDGKFVGYAHAGSSINSAIHFLKQKFGENLKIFIWSLCDGATAALLYAGEKQKLVQGLILCNPYLITEEELARATFKHYYSNRFRDQTFWKKLFSCKVNMIRSFRSLSASMYVSRIFIPKRSSCSTAPALAVKFARALADYPHPVRIILSSNDIVAAAFIDLMKEQYDKKKNRREKELSTSIVKGANHTFTDEETKSELFFTSLKYLKKMGVQAISTSNEQR